MTTQVLFVQGGGEGVHDEWDNKILESLERELGSDYAVRYPHALRFARRFRTRFAAAQDSPSTLRRTVIDRIVPDANIGPGRHAATFRAGCSSSSGAAVGAQSPRGSSQDS